MALREDIKEIWVTNHKITQAEYWELFDSIWFKNENDVYSFQVVDISYTALKALVDNNSLTNNTIYKMYDHRTIHFIDGLPAGSISDAYASWNNGTAVEPIFIKATSTSTLDKVVISELYPLDVLHYDINPVDSFDQSILGKITYRFDPIAKIEAHYDWRNYKFARWQEVYGSDVLDSADLRLGAYELFKTFNDPTVEHFNIKIGSGIIADGDTVPRANNIVFLNATSNVTIANDVNKMTFFDVVSRMDVGYNCSYIKSFAPVLNFILGNDLQNVELPSGRDKIVVTKDGVVSASRYIPDVDYAVLATQQNADSLHFHEVFGTDINMQGNEIINLKLENVTTLSGGDEGIIRQNTIDHNTYVYRNGAWEYLIPSGRMAAANGIATLDVDIKVVQDPASASTTATTTGIPKAVAGKIAAQWIPTFDVIANINKAIAAIDANNQKVINLATPTLDTDAVTKLYVDQLIQGIKGKDAADVATTTNIPNLLTAAPSGLDGVSLQTGYRVLVKDQSTASQNGIYTVTTLGTGANGVWARATDANTWTELESAFVFVEQGTTQADSGWLCTADAVGGILDTTGNNWVLFSNAGGLKQFIGTSNITTLGTITTGVWNATDVALADGGTNASLVASNGGIFYSTDSAGAILAGTPTAQRMLQSGASTSPAWSVATYPSVATGAGNIMRANGTNWLPSTLTIPDTTAVNTVMYNSAANVMSALPTLTNGVLITNGTGVPSISTDITTAVTIGGQYIYRANGTDVAVIDGGTGFSSYTTGDLITAGSASTMVKIPDVAVGNVLISGGVGAVPSYGKCNLTTHVSAILPVVNGGTGFATLQLAGIGRKYTDSIGNAAATSIVVTHNFNTQDCQVTVIENSTNKVVYTDIEMTSLNTITINFLVAPTLDQYRVVVIG